MRHAAARVARGFTLLELLVALVIVSMVTALISQAMSQISQLELRLQESGGETQTQLVRREWLRSTVASALPELISSPLKFTGDAASTRFVSVEAMELAGTGVAPVQVRMATVASGHQLQVVLAGVPGALEPPAPIVLLSWQGAAGRIEYMDADGRWQPRWPADESPELIRRPPRAVRFMVGEQAGGPLVAAVGSNQSPRPSLADWMQQ